jgi:hypothetical protein
MVIFKPLCPWKFINLQTFFGSNWPIKISSLVWAYDQVCDLGLFAFSRIFSKRVKEEQRRFSISSIYYIVVRVGV